MEDCGDKNFGGYCKGEKTQHQFVFEAVKRCQEYPFGVSVHYRAYSENCAFEIVSAPNPLFPDINFIPRKCIVLTHPEETTPMYLLQRLPPADREFKPVPFPKGSRALFDDVKRYVAQKIPSEYAEWDRWDRERIPQSDDAEDFIHRLVIECSLFHRIISVHLL